MTEIKEVVVTREEHHATLGCDYFSAYRKFMKDFHVAVQFCIAHLIRDIKFLTTLPDAPTRAYGEKLLHAVKGMFRVIHRHDTFAPEDFRAALEQAKTQIIRIGIEEAPSLLDEEGKEQKREAQNMAKRFRKHATAYFQFITTPGMDPTNNVAEQAIRFIVIDRHVTSLTLLEQLPKLGGLLPAPSSEISAPLPSVANDVPPKTLAVD